MAPLELGSRGVLHGLPDLVRDLYGFAGNAARWVNVGIPGYRLLLFLALLSLLYFVLSLPVRLIEISVLARKRREEPSEGVLRRLLARSSERPKLVRVSLGVARVGCFVVLWWVLDRMMAFLFGGCA